MCVEVCVATRSFNAYGCKWHLVTSSLWSLPLIVSPMLTYLPCASVFSLYLTSVFPFHFGAHLSLFFMSKTNKPAYFK